MSCVQELNKVKFLTQCLIQINLSNGIHDFKINESFDYSATEAGIGELQFRRLQPASCLLSEMEITTETG